MEFEELQEKFLTLEENYKTLKSDYEALQTSTKDKDERIKSLEEYNQKLFLRATATKKDNIIDEKEDKFESKLLGEYADLLDEDELELLKELEEEL